MSDVVVDINDNIVCVGNIEEGGTTDFDPGSGLYELNATGEGDVFVAKYGSDGSFIWAKSIGNQNWNKAMSVATDDDGNVFVTGFFEDTLDFNPGQGVYNLSGESQQDVFVLKLLENGEFSWAFAISGQYSSLGKAISIDNQGNLLVGGSFRGELDFSAFPNGTIAESSGSWHDAFVVKLPNDGIPLWFASLGGDSHDECRSVDTDVYGNIYLGGGFTGVVDFDPGPSEFFLNSGTEPNGFISKLSPQGDFLWAKQLNSSEQGVIQSIAIASDDVYAVGSFKGECAFDMTTNPTYIASIDESDSYILKLNQELNSVNGNKIVDFSIWPNPTTDLVRLEIPVTSAELELTIKNSLGQQVYSNSDIKSPSFLLELEEPPGLYFMSLRSGTETTTKKLVKLDSQ
jgi:hypothetical protein